MKKKDLPQVEKMLYNMQEAAALIGVHPRTISRLLQRGELKGARFGRDWKISREDLNKLYETKKAATAKQMKEQQKEGVK